MPQTLWKTNPKELKSNENLDYFKELIRNYYSVELKQEPNDLDKLSFTSLPYNIISIQISGNGLIVSVLLDLKNSCVIYKLFRWDEELFEKELPLNSFEEIEKFLAFMINDDFIMEGIRLYTRSLEMN